MGWLFETQNLNAKTPRKTNSVKLKGFLHIDNNIYETNNLKSIGLVIFIILGAENNTFLTQYPGKGCYGKDTIIR